MKSRSQRIIEEAGDVDCIVIANGTEPFLDSSFWYVTGLKSGCFEGSKAIISKDGSLDVVTSILEGEAAEKAEGKVHVYRNSEEYVEIMKNTVRGCRRVGISFPSVTYQSVTNLKKALDGQDIEFVDVSNAIDAVASVKDDDEVRCISKACEITSKVAKELPDIISEGKSEKDAAAEMDIRMKKSGGTGNAFETIAAFGSNSSNPHHTPSDYRLRDGDAALFDFGAKYDMYCSDLTRTIFFGKPPEILERAYEIVLRAQIAGIGMIRAGANAKDVDKAARDIIDASEFKGKFIHTFGHGIGMDVHQSIYVAPKSDQVLKSGNVISAEPGIYIPGIGGIRIEDTVLVTDDGCKILTDYPHEMTMVH